MTEPLHVRPDRVRVAALRLSELAERLSRDLDRWLGHPAAVPDGAAAGGAAEQAVRVLVAAVDRMLMRVLVGLADIAGALAEAAQRYESSDARATRPPGAPTPPRSSGAGGGGGGGGSRPERWAPGEVA